MVVFFYISYITFVTFFVPVYKRSNVITDFFFNYNFVIIYEVSFDYFLIYAANIVTVTLSNLAIVLKHVLTVLVSNVNPVLNYVDVALSVVHFTNLRKTFEVFHLSI